MVFAWVFSITSLVALGSAKLFFALAPGFEMLYLSLSLIVLTPWMFPVIAHIRTDMTSPHSPITESGLMGIGAITIILILSSILGMSVFGMVFFAIFLISIVFHIDSRIYFALALAGLIVTVMSLIYDISSLAESASVLVYLALVTGVFSEIIAPALDRYHGTSRVRFDHAKKILHEYRLALAEYSSLLSHAM